MKESDIKIYLENTEVPQYKSTGASGFDLRAKFNYSVPYFTYNEISQIENGNFNTIEGLYKYKFENIEFAMPYEQFKASVVHAINQPCKIEDHELGLLAVMTKLGIERVNIILPYSVNKFPTNIYSEIPEDDEMQVRPRSGFSSTTLLNVVLGTVDNDWRGNTQIIVQNSTPFSYIILPDTRIAQGVIVEKKRAVFDIKKSKDDLTKTDRGEKGLGSSGLI